MEGESRRTRQDDGIAPGFVSVAGTRLETRWIGPPPEDAPTLVFLHEGLGSVSMWRDFPDRLVERTGCGALIYSRAGYGKSDPAPLPKPVRFMHDEAEILPEILAQSKIRDFILVGHSDGASISLIYAGSQASAGLKGLILEAPHVYPELHGLASITKIGEDYRTSNLRDRLARHHGANVDIAFQGWHGAWLHPDFRAWNIEEYLAAIKVPILILQGEGDEYGTWKQVEAIERQAGGPVEAIGLADCEHSPHREQPEQALQAMAEFVRRLVR